MYLIQFAISSASNRLLIVTLLDEDVAVRIRDKFEQGKNTKLTLSKYFFSYKLQKDSFPFFPHNNIRTFPVVWFNNTLDCNHDDNMFQMRKPAFLYTYTATPQCRKHCFLVLLGSLTNTTADRSRLLQIAALFCTYFNTLDATLEKQPHWKHNRTMYKVLRKIEKDNTIYSFWVTTSTRKATHYE